MRLSFFHSECFEVTYQLHSVGGAQEPEELDGVASLEMVCLFELGFALDLLRGLRSHAWMAEEGGMLNSGPSRFARLVKPLSCSYIL